MTNAAPGGVLGHVLGYGERVQAYVVGLIPRVMTAAVILGVCWVAARAVQAAIMRLGRRGDAAMADVLRLVGRVASGTLVVVGVITALDTLGLKVNAIIAGLGLSGFAIGLATRDALTNVLSGLLIIVYRPFERGDRVMVTGIEGVVEAVDLRYTTLRAEDRSVLIPNSTMLNSTVVIVRKGRMAPGSDGGVKE